MKITLNIPDTVELTYMMKRKDGWFVSVKCPDNDLDPDGVSLGLVTGSHTNLDLQLAVKYAADDCIKNRESMVEHRKNIPLVITTDFLEALGLDEFIEDLALGVLRASKP